MQIYNWLIKRHVSALLDHHQAYRKIVLIKVHSFSIKKFLKVINFLKDLETNVNHGIPSV